MELFDIRTSWDSASSTLMAKWRHSTLTAAESQLHGKVGSLFRITTDRESDAAYVSRVEMKQLCDEGLRWPSEGVDSSIRILS